MNTKRADAALQAQLGLKLVKARRKVEIAEVTAKK